MFGYLVRLHLRNGHSFVTFKETDDPLYFMFLKNVAKFTIIDTVTSDKQLTELMKMYEIRYNFDDY